MRAKLWDICPTTLREAMNDILSRFRLPAVAFVMASLMSLKTIYKHFFEICFKKINPRQNLSQTQNTMWQAEASVSMCPSFRSYLAYLTPSITNYFLAVDNPGWERMVKHFLSNLFHSLKQINKNRLIIFKNNIKSHRRMITLLNCFHK